MFKKSSSVFEEHIEKAIMVIVGLACAYVLFRYVLLSPNVVTYDNRKFTPGQLDIYIEGQSEKIKERLNEVPAKLNKTYEPCSPVFIAKMDCPLDVDTNIVWPEPSSVEMKFEKKYRIPEIGQVKGVAVEQIRAAAYVPTTVITLENVHNQTAYEANDIDLVTVQASFDGGTLADSFQECFSGKELPEDWRDAGLARPVFAAVQLERQHLGAEGEWGEWEAVPRAKIDPRSDEFRVIENVNDLPSGGIMVRLLKSSDPRTQASLLQPEPYQIASAEEEWFPPELHRKFLENRREKEAQERREAIAAEQEERATERDRTRTERRPSRTPASPVEPGGRGGGGEAEYFKMLGTSPAGPSRSTTTRGTRPERERRVEPTASEQPKKVTKPSNDSAIYDDMDKILLGDKDVNKLRESIVFWAHDDTVQPGGSYRYRVRLGVFNPVAGTGQERAEDAAFDSKVILWSGFSDVTEAVTIPERLYFFPVNVQETAKAADVQVCKYSLGYWHSEQFMVKRGEVIGKEVKVEPNEQNKDMKAPETIDYTTGAMLVDLVAVNDWSGDKNLQLRHYFDMLYSFDGTIIKRVAAKLMYWSEELRARYSEIKTLEKRPKMALRPWSSSESIFSGRRTLRGMPTRSPTDRGGTQPITMDEYMMQYMQGPQR
jgi:hypothetical protein